MASHEILVGAVTVPLLGLGSPHGQLRFDENLRTATGCSRDP